jgi:hypothetical protein
MLTQIQVQACTRLVVNGDFGRPLMRLTDQFKAGTNHNFYASSFMIIQKTLLLCTVTKDLRIGGRCLFEEMPSLEKLTKTITNSIRTGSKPADF